MNPFLIFDWGSIGVYAACVLIVVGAIIENLRAKTRILALLALGADLLLVFVSRYDPVFLALPLCGLMAAMVVGMIRLKPARKRFIGMAMIVPLAGLMIFTGFKALAEYHEDIDHRAVAFLNASNKDLKLAKPNDLSEIYSILMNSPCSGSRTAKFHARPWYYEPRYEAAVRSGAVTFDPGKALWVCR